MNENEMPTSGPGPQPRPDRAGPGPDPAGHHGAPTGSPDGHGAGGPHDGAGYGPYRPYGPGVPPPAAHDRGPATDRYFDAIRRTGIVRTDDRWIGGVAGGIARRLGVDPLLVRGLLALSLLVAGAGFIVYAAGWMLLPEERDGRIHAQEMLRGNFDGADIGAGIMLLIGLTWDGARVFFYSPFSWLGGWVTGLFWIGAVGAMIALVVMVVSKRSPGPRPGQSPPGGQAAPPGTPPRPGSATPAAEPTPPNPYVSDAVGPADVPGPGAQGTGPAAQWYRQPGPTRAFPAQPAYGSAAYGPALVTEPPARPEPGAPPSAQATAPRTRGPGSAMVGSVLGVWALALAALLLADRAGAVDAPLALIGIGGLVGLCGLGILVSGLRGRTSGTLGAVAIVALVLAGPTLAWDATRTDIGQAHQALLGTASFQPTSVATAERGYAFAAGTWTVNLTSLDESPELVEVPIAMAAGDLTVIVPSDAAWVATVRMTAGSVALQRAGSLTSEDDVLQRASVLESDAVADGAQPTLRVVVDAVAGSITIEELS